MQRFLHLVRPALQSSRLSLSIGFLSLLFTAGCATISPQPPDAAQPGGAPIHAAGPVAGEAQAPADATPPPIDNRPSGRPSLGKAPVDASLPRWVGRDDDAAPGDLWARIRAGFAMPELDTPLVAEKERFYLQRPDYLQRMFDRGGRYLFHIVEEIEKRGMPTELALLPFVESAMNPVALSHAKAAGLWQFIPSTGRAFNLDQNWWVDNRRDVVKSTEAALDYLQKIYEMHGNDWFLALASYNWGEGAVGRAVRRNQARGLPADYLSLTMPAETRHYVPKLIALKHIVQHADRLGVALPALPDRPYFVTIEKTRPIDLKLAARFAGMTVDEFVALNPAHNRPVISATRNSEIKLPADRLETFLDAVEAHGRKGQAFATWQPYTLQPGETLESVAARAGISADKLRAANDLRRNARILPGTRILSPHRRSGDETRVEDFDGPRIYELVERPAVYHRVRPRETLGAIARRYGTTVAALRKLNNLQQASAPRGARLLVRPANSQTLLTTESGQRRVVAGNEARVLRTSLRNPPVTTAPAARPAAKSAPAVAPKPAARPAASRPARPVARPAARTTGGAAKSPVGKVAAGKRT